MAAFWQGRRIQHPDHAHGLERRAAVLEFGHKLPRQAAEQQAHDEYRREALLDAAAHHLAGMKGANAAGEWKGAKAHSEAYSKALKAVGHDPLGPVPEEVTRRLPGVKGLYKFRPHPGDNLLVDEGGAP